jgi:hypothetical protein
MRGCCMIGDDAFLILNSIYLRKMASPAHISSATGLAPDAVQASLARFAAAEQILDLAGQVLLQPEGTAAVLAYYRETYGPLRAGDGLAAWYGRFEDLNAQFIKLISEWQKSDGDERMQGRAIRVVERLTKALREIEPAIPRYAGYVRRFEASVGLVDQGKRQFMCDPTVDCVHNIWFEFHEDILAVLGRPRDT